jgi:hypothetical protein
MSVVLIFGIMGCAASSATGLLYTCSEGTFDLSNLNTNACFSFLGTECTPECPPCDPPSASPVPCQYIDVKQTTSNTFILSDISVIGGDTGVSNLVKNMTPPASIVGLNDSQLIDTEDDTDGQETSSFTLDLGAVRDVLSVTLTNTSDTTRQADVCGAKIILRRPLYQNEASDSTDAELEESPIIDYVADSYTYTVGGTTWA